MKPKKLEYGLKDGFIDHWLVLGPLTTPVGDAAEVDGFNSSPEVLINDPIEAGHAFVPGKDSNWKYLANREDHLVDISADYTMLTHVRVYAFAEIALPKAARIGFQLETNGATEVWLDGESVLRDDGLLGGTRRIDLDLKRENKLIVGVRQIGSHSCLNLMRMRIIDSGGVDPEEIQILLPTKARQPSRFQDLEKNLAKAYLDEVVNYRGAKFFLRWPEGTGEEFHFHYQVQDKEERIYVEGTWHPEEKTDIGHTVRLFERPFRIVLKAPPREYYELNNRYQREIPLTVLDTQFSETAYGSFASRRSEALTYASKFEDNLFAQIARVELGKGDNLDANVFQAVVANTQARTVGCELALLGLFGAALRLEEAENLTGLKDCAREAAQIYVTWNRKGIDSLSESAQILSAACQILAGQLLGQVEMVSGGVESASVWISEKGKTGLGVWLSNSEMEVVIAALAHLTSLAQDGGLQELAAVMLDRVLFDLASHSFRGALAVSHGATEAEMLKSAHLEATSGISRMLYGMGVFNPHIAGMVSLAVAAYEFPTFFAEIAKDLREEMLSRENIAGVSVMTYRTPDAQLSSAQDFRPGLPGQNELIWTACLGADTIVFANHPACMSEAPARRPGFWLGNAALPRVVQWRDCLVAVYNAPGTGMDFTHAHFPTDQFDECMIKDGWVLGRKGEGYIALTAARGIDLVKEGDNGCRELRSYGMPNVWICQIGRQEVDGSFEEFCAKALATRLEWPGNSVKFQNLRGQLIEFGWEGGLRVDGVEQPLVFPRAIDNPYCQVDIGESQYDIGINETVMRLNFE